MPDTVKSLGYREREREAGSLVEAGRSYRGQKGGMLNQESEAQRKELVPPRAPLEALSWPRAVYIKM